MHHVKFIARKNWFVTGSDDFQLQVFDYNTHERVAAFEAHFDCIRCFDDSTSHRIHCVDWKWMICWSSKVGIRIKNIQVNRVWVCFYCILWTDIWRPYTSILKMPTPSCLPPLTAQSKCGPSVHPPPQISQWKHTINYIDLYPGSDKPYRVTTGEDKTVKVWD